MCRILRKTLQAAEQGFAAAQYNLGVMYDNGQGVRQDDAQAVQWYRKAAEQGACPSQVNLGLMYEQGQGVRQDYAEAFRWYRKAAEQGLVQAQNQFGQWVCTRARRPSRLCTGGAVVSQGGRTRVCWCPS